MIPRFLISLTAVVVGRAVGLGEDAGELFGGTSSWRPSGVHMASGPGERGAEVWRAPPGTLQRESRVAQWGRAYMWQQERGAMAGGSGRELGARSGRAEPRS